MTPALKRLVLPRLAAAYAELSGQSVARATDRVVQTAYHEAAHAVVGVRTRGLPTFATVEVVFCPSGAAGAVLWPALPAPSTWRDLPAPLRPEQRWIELLAMHYLAGPLETARRDPDPGHVLVEDVLLSAIHGEQECEYDAKRSFGSCPESCGK